MPTEIDKTQTNPERGLGRISLILVGIIYGKEGIIRRRKDKREKGSRIFNIMKVNRLNLKRKMMKKNEENKINETKIADNINTEPIFLSNIFPQMFSFMLVCQIS